MRVRPLDETTWPDFAGLVERHNGVWGGCWCMGFHAEGVGRTKTAAQNRSEKEGRVREGRAHAALVYDGATCVGWCQFGPTDELPRIKHQRAYLDGLERASGLADHVLLRRPQAPAQRGRLGRARTALWARSRGSGAARWRAIPRTSKAGRSPASFLHNGTVSMFERHGFERTRRLGKHHWVVTRVVR